MQTRRRKIAAGAPGAEVVTSRPQVADEPEPGAERWAGDPNEEPTETGKGLKSWPAPWGVVVSSILSLDVPATLKRLEAELSLGDGATEYGSVLQAQDKSARNLYDAGRLCRKAKIEEIEIAGEADRELEVLRTAAAEALEQDKRDGKRTKAATLKDIDDRMIASWPDKVLALQRRKEEIHGACRAFETLVEAWQERCRTLRSMADQFKQSGA